MALYAAAISKQTLWHAQQERYDNVYYYDGPNFQAGDENFKRVLDALVEAEKNVHGTNVTFVQGRMWSAGGTKEQNQTMALVDYSGTGRIAGNSMFKEACILVEWVTARPNILGRKVYLRKYIRPGMHPNIRAGLEEMDGTGRLSANDKAVYKAYADAVQQINPGFGAVPWVLTSKSGRLPKELANGVVNDFLISREFRRN